MANRKSAGILAFRRRATGLAVFLVHPGGPFWKGKDLGAWTIPKGEFADDEDPLAAARREFTEETGQTVTGVFVPLAPVRQKAGKMVFAWAVEADVNEAAVASNTFQLEYPYKSGNWITVPEVDEAGWFALAEARKKINPAQVAFLDELALYTGG